MNTQDNNFSEYVVNENAETENKLVDRIFGYLRYWRWFVLSIIVALVLGYFYIQLQIPQYKNQTTILIKDDKNGGSGSEQGLLKELGLNSSGKVIDNEVQIIKSKTLMSKVVESLPLKTSYYTKRFLARDYLYREVPYQVELLKASKASYSKSWQLKSKGLGQIEFNGQPVALNKAFKTEAGLILIKSGVGSPTGKEEYYATFETSLGLASKYAGRVIVEVASKDATVLTISLNDEIPDRGRDILDKLVAVYNQAAIEDKNKTTSNQLAFIQNRLVSIASDLSSAEEKVQNYKSNNNITDLSSESQMFLSNVRDKDDQLSKMKLAQGSLDNLEEYLQSKTDNNTSKFPSLLGIEDPTLVSLVKELESAQLSKESLLRTVPDSNPIVGSINDQITAIKKALIPTIGHVRSGIESNKQQLISQDKKLKQLIKGVPLKERGLLDVMREQDIKNNLFNFLLQRRETTELELASTISDSRIVDKASSDSQPLKPVKGAIYMFFLFCGIIVPVLVISLVKVLNYRITEKSDIERSSRIPIVAEIAQTDYTETVVVANRPKSLIAEQFRNLRTNLPFITSGKEQMVILFTSSISNEGKSLVSLNLGASLAMADKKVIILELDLRRSKLHRNLEIENSQGISNYLIGKGDFKDLIKPIPGQSNYSIITCGPIPPNPAELLMNGKLGELIAELKGLYDIIIMDAPPMLVTDAQIIGKHSDVTFYLVRENVTHKGHITGLNKLYNKKSFKNLHIIYNGMDMKKKMTYGNYSYGYGYYDEEVSTSRKSWIRKTLGL